MKLKTKYSDFLRSEVEDLNLQHHGGSNFLMQIKFYNVFTKLRISTIYNYTVSVTKSRDTYRCIVEKSTTRFHYQFHVALRKSSLRKVISNVPPLALSNKRNILPRGRDGNPAERKKGEGKLGDPLAQFSRSARNAARFKGRRRSQGKRREPADALLPRGGWG